MNEKLLNDSEFIKKLELCELRLMKDGDLDWFLLIPLRENVVEIIDLSSVEQQLLMQEIDYVSRQVKKHNSGKLNIGALGNIVRDLHIHIVARVEGDRAWPGPIWGTKPKADFDPDRLFFWRDIFLNE